MVTFAAKTPMTGELIEMRPVSLDDVPSLRELMRDEEVGLLTGSISSRGESATDGWSLDELLEVYGRWITATDRMVWVIVEMATGHVVGEVVLNDLDVDARTCGFRLWIAGATGRGLGTEATRLALQYAATAGVRRVELEVYDHNPRARHVYEKCGFQLVGTRPDDLFQEGRWIDCHEMAANLA